MQYLHYQLPETLCGTGQSSCRFALYNIRKIRPFFAREAADLVQALVISHLDYCNLLLAGLPASMIKPLQHIQKAAACLMFNLPKFSHVTILFQDLHWLPVSAHIRFKRMALTYKAVNGTALPPSIGQTTHPSLSAPLNYFSC